MRTAASLSSSRRAARQNSSSARSARAAPLGARPLQAVVVRYLAREFEREGEVKGRAPTPAVHGRVGRNRVEGRVNFDRVEGARVNVEHPIRARPARVEDRAPPQRGRNPIVVVPTLTAYVYARGLAFVNVTHQKFKV